MKELRIVPKGADHYYQHFKERLKQRYNLDISREEYDELRFIPLTPFYKISNNKIFSAVDFKGINLWVIKDSQEKVLNTVLERNGRMPAPIGFKAMGISSLTFHKAVRSVDIVLTHLKKEYYKRGYTPRTWLEQKPFNFPKRFYHFVLRDMNPAPNKLRLQQIINLAHELYRIN